MSRSIHNLIIFTPQNSTCLTALARWGMLGMLGMFHWESYITTPAHHRSLQVGMKNIECFFG